jgi:formiminoglutamase
MTNSNLTQLEKRKTESIAHQFNSLEDSREIILIKSSSDIGVTRNFGRNGAKYAPKALINTLKKFSSHFPINEFKIIEFEVSSEDHEKLNFKEAQDIEARKIQEIVLEKNQSPIFHIGGGHDHIYPLLKAYSQLSPSSEIIVINVDAHADTRTDIESHSGNPFRQFSSTFSGKFTLYQIGLQYFANSNSTLNDLQKHEMHILWRDELEQSEKLNRFFSQIFPKNDAIIIFSLDADALSGFEMPSVSAVNPNGLNLQKLMEIYDLYLKLIKNQKPIMGIYELNPVYDTSSGIGIRTMSCFLYDCLMRLK